MNDAHLAKQIPDNGFLHFLRLIFLYLVLNVAFLCFGLGLFFWAAILRSTGGRARDIFLLFIPPVGFYVGTRALWRYTAKNHYWENRSDLNPHPFFGPGRTMARPAAQVAQQRSPTTTFSNETPSVSSSADERYGVVEDAAFACGSCGKSVKSGAKFCESCGTKFDDESIECFYCEAEISASAKFCEACGREFQNADLANDEIEALRNEIALAEKEQKAVAELEELRNEAEKSKESVKEVSLQLAIAESELRTLRLDDGNQLEGEARIELLKKQLAGAEKVERLKNELRLAEAKAEKVEAAVNESPPTRSGGQEVPRTDLQIDRERRYAEAKKRGPKTKKLSHSEAKKRESVELDKRREAAWKAGNRPDSAWTQTGYSKDQKAVDPLAELDARIKGLRSQHGAPGPLSKEDKRKAEIQKQRESRKKGR